MMLTTGKMSMYRIKYPLDKKTQHINNMLCKYCIFNITPDFCLDMVMKNGDFFECCDTINNHISDLKINKNREILMDKSVREDMIKHFLKHDREKNDEKDGEKDNYKKKRHVAWNANRRNRKKRRFVKYYRYKSRQDFANSRPRRGGRFIKKNQSPDIILSGDTTETDSSSETEFTTNSGIEDNEIISE